jgi:hypothetical protein
VRGKAEPGGDFVVTAVLWPGMAPQPPLPGQQQDTYVVLVSGLQLASSKSDMLKVGVGCQRCGHNGN